MHRGSKKGSGRDFGFVDEGRSSGEKATFVMLGFGYDGLQPFT